MVDVWEEMFGIEIEEGPQIGLVDISEVISLFELYRYSRRDICSRVVHSMVGCVKFDASALDSPPIISSL